MNMEILLWRLAVSALTAGAAAVAIRKYVLFFAVVSSGSMLPALKQGDWLVVRRMYGSIGRGDILLFYSRELGQVLVKRVAGLPGDTLVVDTGGREGVFRVPEGKYFLMGDNRKHSIDSRSWKEPYVPKEDVLGKAVARMYPFRRI
jgi:signal peptidase I